MNQQVFPKYDEKLKNAPKLPKGSFKTIFKMYLQWIQEGKREEEMKEMIYFQNEEFVVLYDCFPKAKRHLLILPRDSNIIDVQSLTKDHVGMMKRKLDLANSLVKFLESDSRIKGLEIQMGYHSIPSIQVLHLHLISNDYCSPCLKTKKHWNSFTTDFFLSPISVLKQLETEGMVTIDKEKCEKLVKQKMVNPWNPKQIFSQIPKLKNFLQERENIRLNP